MQLQKVSRAQCTDKRVLRSQALRIRVGDVELQLILLSSSTAIEAGGRPGVGVETDEGLVAP